MGMNVRLNVKAKLFLGFVVFYVISSLVPGIMAVLVDWLDLDPGTADNLTVLFSLFVLIVLGIIIALYLRKWISRPIGKLIRATEELARGNLDVDLDVKTGDEIENLAESLSRMKASLRIAFDWLGPSEIDKNADLRHIKGLGIGDKIVIGLVAFLILNPIVTWLALDFSQGSALGSSAATFLFSLVLLIFIVSYLNKSITEPLVSLANSMEKVSKGDFNTKIKVRHLGDIGRLERSLKSVSERVQKAMKELELK